MQGRVGRGRGTVARLSKGQLAREKIGKNQKIPGSPLAWALLKKKKKVLGGVRSG